MSAGPWASALSRGIPTSAAGLFKRLRALRTIINGLLRSLPAIAQALYRTPSFLVQITHFVLYFTGVIKTMLKPSYLLSAEQQGMHREH